MALTINSTQSIVRVTSSVNNGVCVSISTPLPLATKFGHEWLDHLGMLCYNANSLVDYRADTIQHHLLSSLSNCLLASKRKAWCL